MKQLLLVASLFLFLSFSLDKKESSENQSSLEKEVVKNLYCPDYQSADILKDGQNKNSNTDIDNDWYKSTIEKLKSEEYNITFDDNIKSYQSPNRANNIRFIYHNDGFTAKTRNVRIPIFDENDDNVKEEDKKYKSIPEWIVKFKTLAMTANNSEKYLFEGSDLIVNGNKAFAEDENIRIEYTNDEKGMRQNFIIKRKPDNEGKIKLELTAETKLRMLVGADALMFKDESGEDKLKYSDLKVWDANGKILRAYFEDNDELQITSYELRVGDEKSKIQNLKSQIKTNSKFHIVVNDEDAVYPITIDPLSTTPSWTAESNQVHAEFGSVVSTAGDVNGDGYSDILIGARLYDGGQTNEGKVFVYHGSAAGLLNNYSGSYEGDQENAFYGASVSTAGDINGDGFSDVIIGSPNYSNFEFLEGHADVFNGSASGLLWIASWSGETNIPNAYFGSSVSTAGDVNGDGYSDIIVGAPGGWGAYAYYGSASGLNNLPNWAVVDDIISSSFGQSVSTAGDVNGDGYSDVIIGTPNYSNGQTNEGRATVFHGSSAGLSYTSGWSVESNNIYSYYGSSVSTAGDVNGDGFSDIIIGAYGFSNTFTGEGKVFVYNGSPSGLPTTASWTKLSDESYKSFGSSVSTAGDINGDGYGDVVIGAPGQIIPGDSPNNCISGNAFVYYGSSSGLSSINEQNLSCDQDCSLFGSSVSIAGDVNGDGFSDILVGAPVYTNSEAAEGRAFLYNGSASGLSAVSNWTAEGNQNGSYFGACVSSAGDVNSDGYNDIIIGAPDFDTQNGANTGRVFAYYGSQSGLPAFPDWIKDGTQTLSRFGWSVSTAGDVNGDGYCDVVVGSYLFDNSQADGGKIDVFHGSTSGLSQLANMTYNCEKYGAGFGSSVSSAGDVNGDGYNDVIVGASGYKTTLPGQGRAFVFHGSVSGLSRFPVWSAEGVHFDQQFGNSVSSAGDVNGDGYSDVIIGAHFYSNGQANEGGAFVYHGSINGLSLISNWSAQSNNPGARFGYSVSSAGDVNGDGFSDIIVGAPFFEDESFGTTGRAFIYNGSPSGLAQNSSSSFTHGQDDAEFGISVSGAGDINGDGYSDVIIGADKYGYGQIGEGAAFLYQGSPSGLNNSSWSVEGNQDNALLGFSVASAGDVNGDGYSDVIVGAYLYSNGESQEGKTFTYYGNEKTGLKTTVVQFKANSDIIYSGGYSGTNGEVNLGVFGRCPFGRADGKIVYEHKINGVPFSGTKITNSTGFTGSGSNLDLMTGGKQLNKNITGLSANEFKWRARVQYSLVNNPYQKFGPWKYYNNFVPNPLGNFRPQNIPPLQKQLNLTAFIQGLYNPVTNLSISDTLRIYLRTIVQPYDIVDSNYVYMNPNGTGTFSFINAINNTRYFIQTKHRNAIETWSAAGNSFLNSSLAYNFSTSISQAYGNNLFEADVDPLRFAIYSGDVNQDGTIDLSDLTFIENDASEYVTGHVNTDLTGDDYVDLSDYAIADNNAFLFVSVQRPY